MIPWLVWCEERQAKCINIARKHVNWEVCQAVCNGLRSVIGHHEIHVNRPELFRMDGVHLSDRGLEIVLVGLREGAAPGARVARLQARALSIICPYAMVSSVDKTGLGEFHHKYR